MSTLSKVRLIRNPKNRTIILVFIREDRTSTEELSFGHFFPRYKVSP